MILLVFNSPFLGLLVRMTLLWSSTTRFGVTCSNDSCGLKQPFLGNVLERFFWSARFAKIILVFNNPLWGNVLKDFFGLQGPFLGHVLGNVLVFHGWPHAGRGRLGLHLGRDD